MLWEKKGSRKRPSFFQIRQVMKSSTANETDTKEQFPHKQAENRLPGISLPSSSTSYRIHFDRLVAVDCLMSHNRNTGHYKRSICKDFLFNWALNELFNKKCSNKRKPQRKGLSTTVWHYFHKLIKSKKQDASEKMKQFQDLFFPFQAEDKPNCDF